MCEDGHLQHSRFILGQFVGVPYKLGGRSILGCDCYGLVILFFRRIYGVELPDIGVSSLSQVSQTIIEEEKRPHWSKIDKPTFRAVAVFSENGLPRHCGVMLDRTRMLHNAEQRSCVEKIDTPVWRAKLYGFYRYTSTGKPQEQGSSGILQHSVS